MVRRVARMLLSLALVGLLLALVSIWWQEWNAPHPPLGTSLAQFVADGNSPETLYVASVDGRQWIVWFHAEAPGAVVSGPPCLVFDDHGLLVTRTSETNEGTQVDRFLARSWNSRRPITIDEAIAMTEKANADRAAAD